MRKNKISVDSNIYNNEDNNADLIVSDIMKIKVNSRCCY